MWEIPAVRATVDASKRVRIRQAKPGEEYHIEPLPTGFLLTRLVKEKPKQKKYRLCRKDGFLMIKTEGEVKIEDIQKALADFP